MNNKFIKFSALILAALTIFAAFPWLRSKMSNGSDKKTGSVSVDMSGFRKETVNRIIIKKGNDEKILSFKDGKWFIGENETDEEKINQLFKDFADLKIKEMVSNNDENWSKFEVSKDSGYQMIITQNGKDNTFLVGKAGSLVNDFYIRKEGIKNVYLANGELRNKMAWENEKWGKAAENKK
jgi:hypothetical protein